jgi:hypothetical protein
LHSWPPPSAPCGPQSKKGPGFFNQGRSLRAGSRDEPIATLAYSIDAQKVAARPVTDLFSPFRRVRECERDEREHVNQNR